MNVGSTPLYSIKIVVEEKDMLCADLTYCDKCRDKKKYIHYLVQISNGYKTAEMCYLPGRIRLEECVHVYKWMEQ